MIVTVLCWCRLFYQIPVWLRFFCCVILWYRWWCRKLRCGLCKCYFCVSEQPVGRIYLSVTLVNACISTTGVTATVTAVTAVMNATAVSYKLTCFFRSNCDKIVNDSFHCLWSLAVIRLSTHADEAKTKEIRSTDDSSWVAWHWLEMSKVQCPAWHIIVHFGDHLPSQSLDYCKAPKTNT